MSSQPQTSTFTLTIDINDFTDTPAKLATALHTVALQIDRVARIESGESLVIPSRDGRYRGDWEIN